MEDKNEDGDVIGKNPVVVKGGKTKRAKLSDLT